MISELVLAVLIGVLQGIFEWIPISSEGVITLFLTTVIGVSPRAAVRLALFVQAGTILSVLVYYRDDLIEVLIGLPSWRPQAAFDAYFTAPPSGVRPLMYCSVEKRLALWTTNDYVWPRRRYHIIRSVSALLLGEVPNVA